MKVVKAIIIMIVFYSTAVLRCQVYSNITYDAGSSIDIQSGGDVCADNIIINGSFSGGGTICTGALPVTLSIFNALSQKNNVVLSWKTESEINNFGFDVERKTETGGWNKIAFVQGSGTTNQPVEYTYEDKKLMPGKYFYRLKQIDYNGNYEYFDLALYVLILKPQVFSMGQNYPNPSNPSSNIDFQLPERTLVNISVYNLLGQLVTTLVNQERDAGIYTIEFDGSNVSSGTYIYRITAGSYSEVRKMLIIK
ncbi:MAG: T9SS type A sorting domain-containing protein [Ignavibacteria bacterium]